MKYDNTKIYKFNYENYPFEVATRLCIERAQKDINEAMTARIEVYKTLDLIKNYGIIPTIGNMIVAYDIVEKQIHNLIKQELGK